MKVGDKIDIPNIGTVEVLANDALVAGQETAAENNGVVLLPERVVFTAENVADYNFYSKTIAYPRRNPSGLLFVVEAAA